MTALTTISVLAAIFAIGWKLIFWGQHNFVAGASPGGLLLVPVMAIAQTAPVFEKYVPLELKPLLLLFQFISTVFILGMLIIPIISNSGLH